MTKPSTKPLSKPLVLPELSLVLLMGASSSGKSTFAAKHFKPTEILSSDFFRAMVSDDPNNQDVTNQAFDALHYVAAARLKLGRLTVVDATNLQAKDRQGFVELAKRYHCIPAIIVMNVPRGVCFKRNETRGDRLLGDHALRNQLSQVRRSVRGLRREGFRNVYVLNSVEEMEAAVIRRQVMWTDRKDDHGPFDIIGDVHGCFAETVELLEKLGYDVQEADGFSFGKGFRVTHPEGRKPVFLGDLVDRGPGVVAALRLVMSIVESETGLCVPGNHDIKLVRKLRGKDVKIKYGLAQSLEEMEKEPETFHRTVIRFLDTMVSHYVLDDGNLVVAHAGMKERYQGRGSNRIRAFALYGDTTGETDEFGLPVRLNWGAEYRGRACVVYGHTPVYEPQWLNRTINIDTGCVYGGRLSALRYPEKEIVSVPAKEMYAEPARPITPPKEKDSLSLQQEYDDLLDFEDVSGKMIVSTSLRDNVTIREQHATAALEVMSRFAINPKWLIHLPPTMSPTETSRLEGFLEHPAEAFDYYSRQGVREVVCEEKHMGSRAIVILCKSEKAAAERFGVSDGKTGVCYTRTGRAFFNDEVLEKELLERLRKAIEQAGFWDTFKTGWICLDCEIMPWSVKAQELLRRQYAAVGSASQASLAEAHAALEQTLKRGMEVEPLLKRTKARREMAAGFVEAYRNYCWTVQSIDDLKLAPFHILAVDGHVFVDKPHTWHMETIGKLCKCDPQILRHTETRVVELSNENQVRAGIDWWLELTGKGGEGMVVKPMDFAFKGEKGLVQPAVKCRGKEYLRIIYGPEYTMEENLERLRKRGLATKRSLALREFALGIEGLERFVRKEPLRRVHECAFGVLALESEPVDPRL
ncbi:MAG: polynucleotide kinase-phosphatase [bacterium]|nr:polynucleotide kinase-phosphatase [bacterium]